MFAAAHSDVFGDEPDLSAMIKNADLIYANGMRFLGAVRPQTHHLPLSSNT